MMLLLMMVLISKKRTKALENEGCLVTLLLSYTKDAGTVLHLTSYTGIA
jgi:hypothetical protein